MGRLTSQVAHELNNPIYGIMNTLELLKTEIPPRASADGSWNCRFRNGTAFRHAQEHAELFEA